MYPVVTPTRLDLRTDDTTRLMTDFLTPETLKVPTTNLY